MIIIPEDGEENLVIVGIDPGTDTLGACVTNVELSGAFRMTVIDVITFNGTLHLKHNRRYQEYAKVNGDRFARIRAIEEALIDWFNRHKPHLVCSESPFMYHSPHAFASLTESLTSIKAALYKYDSDQNLFLVPPQMAKSAIGSTKSTDKKEGVKPALKKLLEDQFKSGFYLGPNMNLDEMTEHELDAVAVAYTRYVNLSISGDDKHVR